MILVITLLAALLAAGAVALYVQISDTRGSGMVRGNRAALYCAEAGLVAAREVVSANSTQWNLVLDGNAANDPAWYPITGDIDGDTVADYIVTLRDNDDEPNLITGNDPTTDNDLRVFMVSRCVKYPNTPRTLMELIQFSTGAHVYRNQSGQGAGNTGNSN